MGDYKNNSESLILKNNALKKGIKVIIDKLSSDGNYHNMFKWEKDADGNEKAVDIIDENDVYKQLKKSKFQEAPGYLHYDFEKSVNLSDQEIMNISKAYIDGTLNVEYVKKYNETVGEVSYYEFEWNGMTIKAFNDGTLNFPSSKEYSKKLEKINERVPIPIFNNAVGNVSASPFYKISGQLQKDIIDDLAKPTLTNSNIYTYTEGTSTASPVKPEDQGTARTAMLDKDNVLDVSLFTSSPLNGGGQAVSVTFKPIEGTEKKEAPAWAGKTFYFPINLTSSSPKIFHVFSEVNDVSEFAPFQKEGKPYTLDAFQAEGVKAILQPREPGASNGTVELWYKPYNAATKTYSDTWQKQENGLEYDLSKKTFAEYKSDIYNGFIYPYVDGTIIYNKQQQANTISSGGTVTTADGLYKTLRPY
jgi:hypothetical protein